MVELADNYLLDERLRIERRLGEGGFGTVYEARDEHLGRKVAVKVLKDSVLNDPSVRKRFVREGKILAQVQSEFLVRLFSVNISGDGFLYMVMELVDGMPLRAELNQVDKLNEQDTLNVARGVALALKALSSHGVVHRDLKPDNIMLLRTADGITTKVLDFGLSGLVNKVDVKDSYVTASGTILGSVHYIAPETCMGEKSTFQSDCYALGCLLYECLVGVPPFLADDPAAVVFKHVSETPIDPVISCPTLRKGIRQLLTRLLQKEPSLRFENADDLLTAVDLCIEGAVPPVKSGGSELSTGTGKTSKNTAVIVISACAAVLCLSVFGYLYVRQQKQQVPEIDSAEVGGNRILKLGDQIRGVKPDGSLSYQQSTQLLARMLQVKTVPAKAVNDLRAQILACDKRLESASIALIKEVDHKNNGLSSDQYDAIKKAGAKLKLIGHRELSQKIFGATLICIARSLDTLNNQQARAQLCELLEIYLQEGGVELSVLDSVSNSFARVQVPGDDLDLGLDLRLAHVFRQQKGTVPPALQTKIDVLLDSARAKVLGANQGLLVQQALDAVKQRDCDSAKHFALANLRGLKAVKPPGEIAEACFAMGCILSECDPAAGAEYYKRAMLFAEEGHRVDDLYLDSINNYARYLIGVREFDKARLLVWKIHKIIVSGIPFPDNPKVGWMQVALGLPLKSDHVAVKNAIQEIVQSAPSIGIREPRWRVEALLAYGVALDCLQLHREATLVLAPACVLARKVNVNPVVRHSILRLYAVELRRSGDRRALELYKELFLKDAYSQTMKGMELAGLYAELADVQKFLCSPGSLTGVVLVGLPDYYSCLEKSMRLRGLSQPWCRLYSQAVEAFHSKNYEDAEKCLLSLLKNPETEKISDGERSEIGVRLIECQLALHKETEALAQIPQILKFTQSFRACLAASGCYFAVGQFDNAGAAIEKCLRAAYASPDLAHRYAGAQTLLAKRSYSEAESILSGLSKAIESSLPKEYVDHYHDLVRQCRERKSTAGRFPTPPIW